jgi:chorismate mutase/prephenate dehydratase
VENGRSTKGVVPAENTIEGVVNHTLDLLLEASLEIVGEILVSIDHYLLSHEASLGQVREVYSHPQALAQCRPWISSNLKGAKLIEVASTAEAASKVSREKETAAIASQWAADRYGLSILAERIDKVPGVEENITRFLVLGCHSTLKTGDDKTSIAFAVRDEVGALVKMLEPFSRHDINLMKIESRPSRKTPWEYTFYLDLEGHADDSEVRQALQELKESSRFLKILGSYKRAK